jgi:hypothetical protein
MQDYESAGHMEEVQPPPDNNTVCYYLPHHPVFKSTSTTTKTRVVFDGSAKTTPGVALNDILQTGPTIQEDLYSLVLRFQTYATCFTADIEQMYRQITMHPKDRNLQRILWRIAPDQPIQEYCLKTVTHGTASALFLATRCLKKLAEDNMLSHPKAAQVLLNDLYVDVLLRGTSTVQEAIEIQQDLTALLASAGYPLRKWASNNSQFLAVIPELQERKQSVSLDNEDGVMTLGLQWSPKHDELQVRHNSPTIPSQRTADTKQTVLAITASIFDPLGLLSPTVIMYKKCLSKHYGNSNWIGILNFPHHCRTSGVSCIIPFHNCFILSFHERLFVQMSLTLKFMAFVMLVSRLMELVCIFAPLTTKIILIVNCYVRLPESLQSNH